jgi:hypothetical protein
MGTIRTVSSLRSADVRVVAPAIEPQNAEDPGILEGTPGSRTEWLAFWDAYRTFWVEADGEAMAEMADTLMLLDSAPAK